MRDCGWLGVVWLALGCGPAVGTSGAEGTDEGSSASTTSNLPGTSNATASMTDAPTGSTTSGTTLGDTGTGSTSILDTSDDVSFIQPSEGGVCHCECDVWSQDCARGDKCNPWANDGGTVWNATRCVPIDRDPGAPGDPCEVIDGPASGFDSCQLGAMCWDVDPETGVGVCVEFCSGSEVDPDCRESTQCMIANDGVLILCLPECDPMLDECGPDHTCAPQAVGGAFVCMPGSGPTSDYGQPCDEMPVCDPGMTCVSSSRMDGLGACTLDVAGCCTLFCDLSDADPDASCPDVASGQFCEPFYAEGEAPPGFENVGVCVLP